jgi:hypothetical protein
LIVKRIITKRSSGEERKVTLLVMGRPKSCSGRLEEEETCQLKKIGSKKSAQPFPLKKSLRLV